MPLILLKTLHGKALLLVKIVYLDKQFLSILFIMILINKQILDHLHRRVQSFTDGIGDTVLKEDRNVFQTLNGTFVPLP